MQWDYETDFHTQTRSTHLVWTDSAEGFLSRVRGQGKWVDFGQMWLYVKLHAYTDHTDQPCRAQAEETHKINDEIIMQTPQRSQHIVLRSTTSFKGSIWSRKMFWKVGLLSYKVLTS